MSDIAEETESTILLESEGECSFDGSPPSGSTSSSVAEASAAGSGLPSSFESLVLVRRHPIVPVALEGAAALAVELAWRVVASLLWLGWIRQRVAVVAPRPSTPSQGSAAAATTDSENPHIHEDNNDDDDDVNDPVPVPESWDMDAS